MDTRRVLLFAALIFVVFSLWTNWQKDYPPAINKDNTVSTQDTSSTALLPDLPRDKTTTTNANMGGEQQSGLNAPAMTGDDKPSSSNKAQKGPVINVKTDVLSLLIDTSNGSVVKAELLAYPLSTSEQNKPVTLLFDEPEHRYLAESNFFVTSSDNKIKNVDFNFSSDSKNFQLEEGQDHIVISLTGKTADGLKATKTYTLHRGSYLIDVAYQLENTAETAWKGYLNNQLLQKNPIESSASLFQVGSYSGASYSNPGTHRYKKVSFKDMGKSNLNVDATGGWVAMQQHYFLSAWVPNKDSKNVIYSRAANDDYTIGMVSEPIAIGSQKSTAIQSQLYLGPETTAVLKDISPGLELTVDYGWLWFLSSFLFTILKTIYSFIGNWGWSIVLVTVLIKLAFYRLSASSYKSMAGMRKLQPKLQALRERYGDDKAKISQATMELYRQEKVNPLGGCLPIIIQIPVFIALYWVLLESVELRQAPFIFWIKDLSVADPWHVLPVIMGLTMLVQQRLNPAPPDPMQAKVMMFLPILFTALFWSFPSGLVLYWIVNNTLSILQQWHITRKYSEMPPPKNKKSKPLAVVK